MYKGNNKISEIYYDNNRLKIKEKIYTYPDKK